MTSLWKITVSITGKKKRVSSKALFALVFYLVLPTIAIISIMIGYPELSDDRLLGILVRTIPISIMLILISQFGIRYEKGDKMRFILGECYVLLVLLWLFALLGGEPVIHQTWEQYHFSLHIWNYLALIFFVTAMNIIYYIIEYQAYCKKEPAKSYDGEEEADKEEAPKHRGVVITTT